MKQARTAKDELRDARRRLRHACLHPIPFNTTMAATHREPVDVLGDLRKSKRIANSAEAADKAGDARST